MKLKIKSAIALGYHDVAELLHEQGNQLSISAAVYTLDRRDFQGHIAQIALALGTAVPKQPLFLTFDDGTVSAITIVAGELEKVGLRGHFFVTTDWIGREGFLTPAQIKQLSERGHIIGSHSCSHPERMSKLPDEQLISEWTRSLAVLERILGKPVTVASVPGGYYSKRVARAAAKAGCRVLFTSEPTSRITEVDECIVIGRYSLKRRSPASLAGAIASGGIVPRWKQYIVWNTKKPVKFLAGDLYLSARRFLLRPQCQL